MTGHFDIFFQVRYCSQECRSVDFDDFHWAECGFIHHFQDESIGKSLALLVYRLVAKSRLETCLETSKIRENEQAKNVTYDSSDYSSVLMQVCNALNF